MNENHKKKNIRKRLRFSKYGRVKERSKKRDARQIKK